MNQAPPQNVAQHESADKNGSRSCLFYGCLFSFLFMVVLVVVGAFFGYRSVKNQVSYIKEQVNKYTSDAPANLPVVEYTEEDLAALENRVKQFQQDVEQGEVPETLVLTAEEINALISKEDDLRGKVYVTIHDGQISGQVSMPTDFLPGGKGRHFNASATFNVSLEDGVLTVTLADAVVKGEKVPERIIEGFAKENLAKGIHNEREVAKALSKFDRLTIEEDRIILTPRVAPAKAE